jgi:hypothetical protein
MASFVIPKRQMRVLLSPRDGILVICNNESYLMPLCLEILRLDGKCLLPNHMSDAVIITFNDRLDAILQSTYHGSYNKTN